MVWASMFLQTLSCLMLYEAGFGSVLVWVRFFLDFPWRMLLRRTILLLCCVQWLGYPKLKISTFGGLDWLDFDCSFVCVSHYFGCKLAILIEIGSGFFFNLVWLDLGLLGDRLHNSV